MVINLKKKDYFNFGSIFNAKSTTLPYLISKYYQEKNQILILIWIIYKKKINNYLVTILKLFVLLFYAYQRLFFALVDLDKVNLYHVLPTFALIFILFLNLKYHLDLIRYYARLYILLFIYKHIYTINN